MYTRITNCTVLRFLMVYRALLQSTSLLLTATAFTRLRRRRSDTNSLCRFLDVAAVESSVQYYQFVPQNLFHATPPSAFDQSDEVLRRLAAPRQRQQALANVVAHLRRQTRRMERVFVVIIIGTGYVNDFGTNIPFVRFLCSNLFSQQEQFVGFG